MTEVLKEVFDREVRDEIIVWGMGDVTHTPEIQSISLSRHKGWEIGQKVRITIELIQDSEESVNE